MIPAMSLNDKIVLYNASHSVEDDATPLDLIAQAEVHFRAGMNASHQLRAAVALLASTAYGVDERSGLKLLDDIEGHIGDLWSELLAAGAMMGTATERFQPGGKPTTGGVQ